MFYCFLFRLWTDLLACSGQQTVRNATGRSPRSMPWGESHTYVLTPDPLGVMWRGLHALLIVVVWIRMALVNSNIWICNFQFLEVFGKECELCHKSSKKFQSSTPFLVTSLSAFCLLMSCKLSAMASAPHLYPCGQMAMNSNALELRVPIKCFLL